MLYWILIGLGLAAALAGFALMLITQRKEQKAWQTLLKEDKSTAEERFKELQIQKFAAPLRLSLFLILGGLALGVVGLILR